jgi:hypothetical protein
MNGNTYLFECYMFTAIMSHCHAIFICEASAKVEKEGMHGCIRDEWWKNNATDTSYELSGILYFMHNVRLLWRHIAATTCLTINHAAFEHNRAKSY